LATPITNLDDKSIFEAYKANFEMLEATGYKPNVNVMDNQGTKYIKKFLTEKGCQLQLIEPHNHRVNAAERAIQTFKDAFIAALAMTDRDFLLQLWDKLAPQVQDTLNLLRTSRTNPEILAYEALNGPYDWNRYPLAPPGCKAGGPWIMGIPWHRRMIPGPIQGPLLVQFVLCSRIKSVPYIRVGRTLPAALPTPEPKPGRASESTHGRVANGNNRCGGDHKRKGPPQIATHSP